MAIRVRKLAKELRQTPGETLGILHHLGFPRYRSPNDMVSEPIAQKARSAVRQGVRAPAVAIEAPRPSAPPPAALPSQADDLMAQLIPGMVPMHGAPPARPVEPRESPPPPPPPAAAPKAPPAPVVERPAPAAAPDGEEVAALREALRAVEAERDALREEVATLTAHAAAPPEGVTVQSLLHTRGLRGADEAHRALAELAQQRSLAPLLAARLGPATADALQAELGRLLLLDGPKPDGLDAPAVAVAPERSEAPGSTTMERALSKASQEMLLCGFRRMRFVGVSPRWHGAIRTCLDRRVDAQFAPGGDRDPARVAADASDVDVVLYVGVALSDDARSAGSGTLLVEAPCDLAAALDALVRALMPGDPE